MTPEQYLWLNLLMDDYQSELDYIDSFFSKPTAKIQLTVTEYMDLFSRLSTRRDNIRGKMEQIILKKFSE